MFDSRINTFFKCFGSVFSAVVALGLVAVDSASALPWDIDMYRQQSFQSGELARGPAKGTVPYGTRPLSMSTEEAGKTLKNDVPFERDSVWRGQRVWQANCFTCHGDGKSKGPVASYLPVPDLTEQFYKDRTDGYIYGVIHNGGAAMPRYGFKFSEREHWDLVNYVRFLQGRNVDGQGTESLHR